MGLKTGASKQRMEDELKSVSKEAVSKTEEISGFMNKEDLVKSQQSDKKEEYGARECVVSIQQQTQQVEDQSFPSVGPHFENTLDAKLASIFPTQFAGYFQNFGHPLKCTAHLVQDAMQSAVDPNKELLQSREVIGSYRKLPTIQPSSSQSISRGQMQMSLSTVAASYNIGGQASNSWHLPYVNGNVRVAIPFTSTQTQRDNQFLSITATDSVSNIPTSVSTSLVKGPLRLPEHYTSSYITAVPELQPRNMHGTTPLPRHTTEPVARAALVTETPLRKPESLSQDIQPRNMYNSTALFENPGDGTGSGWIGLSSSKVGSHLDQEVPEATGSDSGHTHDQTEVTPIPDFQSGRVDAKKFPPRYYELSSLEIGTWKYHRRSQAVSRLKVIFSQRKFVYEFLLHSIEDIAQENQPASENNKHMVCIEVPFSTVAGLNISRTLPTEVIVEVDTVPAMWLGKQIKQHRSHGVVTKCRYNMLNPGDLTNGQLTTVPYHKLIVSSTVIATHLMKFDAKFSALLRIPILINTNKTPPKPMKPLQSFRSTKRKWSHKDSNPEHLQSSTSPLPLNHCSCTAGCSTKRCSCVRENSKCQDCRCNVPCKNPLNIMAEFGVDLDKAKRDICLMQKLPKIFDLRTLLRERTVPTPCCDWPVPLKTCCGALVKCPECETEYRYSWCTGSFCDEENRPRNHCEICHTCRDYRDLHCSNCNKCYFAGFCCDFPCPCCNVKYGRNLLKFL